jgi:S1-C subfamily serine protease
MLRGRAISLIFLLQATACTATYPVVGSFNDYNEVFKGQVNADLMRGTSFIQVTGQNSGIKCTGGSRVLHVPASNYIAGMFLIPYCEGQTGIADLACDDGRRIRANWTADSCTSGSGSGHDQHGAVFQFAFGMSDAEARDKLAQQAAVAATRPALPVYKPKETRKQIGFSTGTAFLVTSDGYLVTNYHVIEDASQISLLVDGATVPARVITRDQANDVALLKAEIRGTPISVSASAKLAVAEQVMTLGYPLVQIQGQALKASFGRVNALSGIGDDPRLVQIDVPIQPGNSGGPLVNERGELVGVVTATLNQLVTLRETGSLPQNVNYAVKAEYIRAILAELNLEKTSQSSSGFKAIVERYATSVYLVVAK